MSKKIDERIFGRTFPIKPEVVFEQLNELISKNVNSVESFNYHIVISSKIFNIFLNQTSENALPSEKDVFGVKIIFDLNEENNQVTLYKDEIVHSYSSINTFVQCKKKYLLSKENKKELKKYEETGIQNGGKFMHLFMELYYKHCKSKQLKTDITIFDKLFKETLTKFEITLTPGEIIESKKILQRTIENEIVHFENLIDTEKFITVNRKFEICDYNSDEAFFCGVIDRFERYDDYILITDYKTGHSKNADPFQLNCYALLTQALYPDTDIKLQFNFMRHNYRETFDITNEGMKETMDLIFYYDENIRKAFSINQFPEKSNDWCVYCKFNKNCFKDLTFNGESIDLLHHEEIEKNYFHIESLVKQQKSALKELFKKDGNLFWKDGYWGDKETEKFIVKDKKELFQIFEALELDPFKYFDITTTSLKKILYSKKIDQDVKDNIFDKEIIEVEKTFNFEWIKEPKSIYLDHQEIKNESVNKINNEKKDEGNEVLDKLSVLGGTVEKIENIDKTDEIEVSNNGNQKILITPPQVKIICTIFTNMNIKEKEYKEFIYESFKINSIKNMSKKHATDFIDILNNIEKSIEGYELRFDTNGKLKIIRPKKNRVTKIKEEEPSSQIDDNSQLDENGNRQNEENEKQDNKNDNEYENFMEQAATIATGAKLNIWDKRYHRNKDKAIIKLDKEMAVLNVIS